MSRYEDNRWYVDTEEELFDYEGSKLIEVKAGFYVEELDEDDKKTGKEESYRLTLTDKQYGEILVKFDFADQSVLREAIENLCQKYAEVNTSYKKFKITRPRIFGYVWDTAIKRKAMSKVETFSNALVELEDRIFQLKQECTGVSYSRVGEEYLVNYKNYLEESVNKLQELDNAVKQLLSTYLEKQK